MMFKMIYLFDNASFECLIYRICERFRSITAVLICRFEVIWHVFTEQTVLHFIKVIKFFFVIWFFYSVVPQRNWKKIVSWELEKSGVRFHVCFLLCLSFASFYEILDLTTIRFLHFSNSMMSLATNVIHVGLLLLFEYSVVSRC